MRSRPPIGLEEVVLVGHRRLYVRPRGPYPVPTCAYPIARVRESDDEADLEEEAGTFERLHCSVDQFTRAMSSAAIISRKDSSTLSGIPKAPLASWATNPCSAER